MTQESLGLFAELLNQVVISPMDNDGDAKWARLSAARKEILAESAAITQAGSDDESSLNRSGA